MEDDSHQEASTTLLGKRQPDTDADAEPSKKSRETLDASEEPAFGGAAKGRARKQPVEEPVIEDMPIPSQISYRVENGVRYLAPYWSQYRCQAKGRWFGREMEEVFRTEFLSQDPHYAAAAIRLGRIFVNGKRMTNLGYRIRGHDKIVHYGHRHEHPILDVPIQIIDDTEDLLVVNKPPSMPVHPCGQYRVHTVLGLLHTLSGIKGLRVLHRLDRTTSGVLMMAKNYATDLEFKQTLKAGEWKKEYICRVEGVFPSAPQVCEKPIGTLAIAMGIQCVRDDEKGKTAVSRFRRLWTDGETSVVHCHIETGRTHQIRVHLQYLGYPIVGDLLYNSHVWGTTKGKNADYGKPFEQLCKDVAEQHKAEAWHEEVDPEYRTRLKGIIDAEVVEPEDFDPTMPEFFEKGDYDPYCIGCNVVKRKPTMEHLRMMLHCWRYETTKWSYEAQLPEWAWPPPADATVDADPATAAATFAANVAPIKSGVIKEVAASNSDEGGHIEDRGDKTVVAEAQLNGTPEARDEPTQEASVSSPVI
ncbi:Protein K07E8.7 [Aphelenchoides avenae]|nr:Protein K07E8.7 [Aphelenchus avenae]